MKKRKRLFYSLPFTIFFLLIISSSSSLSFAQSYQTFRSELNQIVENVRWRVGPFRIRPAVNFRVIGYDNNVFYQEQQEGTASDFTATVSPDLNVFLIFRNSLILTFTDSLEYVYYFKHKSERRLNNTISPKFRILLLGRFVFSGSYTKSSRWWRATSEFNSRAREKRDNYEGSMHFETPRGTSLGISVYKTKISYGDSMLDGQEASPYRILSRSENSAQLELTYRIFSQSSFFLTGGYIENVFENPESKVKNSISYQINSGISFPLLGDVRGALSLGYKKLLPKEGEKKSFSGIVGDTNFELTRGRFVFHLGYARDCPFSSWTNNIFYIDSRISMGLSFYLTRFLRVNYTYSLGGTSYPELIPLVRDDGSYEEIKRKDTYGTHTASFVVRIIRNIGLGVRVNSWQRSSNYLGESRTRTYVGTYIEYAF